jgi:hypothetical protein
MRFPGSVGFSSLLCEGRLGELKLYAISSGRFPRSRRRAACLVPLHNVLTRPSKFCSRGRAATIPSHVSKSRSWSQAADSGGRRRPRAVMVRLGLGVLRQNQRAHPLS